jgi:hypothetical protein
LKRFLVVMVLLAVLGGCAGGGLRPDGEPRVTAPPVVPTAPPLAPTAEPPPPAVNLAGFPLPYRQGYADGCASATGPQRKDLTRFGSDGNYRTGWTDGVALCAKKK